MPLHDRPEPTHCTASTNFPGSDFTREETEFLRAVEAWKMKTGKKFPTHVDYLRVLLGLGYRKGGEK